MISHSKECSYDGLSHGEMRRLWWLAVPMAKARTASLDTVLWGQLAEGRGSDTEMPLYTMNQNHSTEGPRYLHFAQHHGHFGTCPCEK